MNTPLQIPDYLVGIANGMVCFSIHALPGILAGDPDHVGKNPQKIDMALRVDGDHVGFLKNGEEVCWLTCPHKSILNALGELKSAILTEFLDDLVVRATVMPILTEPVAHNLPQPRRSAKARTAAAVAGL